VRRNLNEPKHYAKCFADGWYLTGGLAMRDADGHFWFVGRTNDVIKSTGHLIGSFEVESALMEPVWRDSNRASRKTPAQKGRQAARALYFLAAVCGNRACMLSDDGPDVVFRQCALE